LLSPLVSKETPVTFPIDVNGAFADEDEFVAVLKLLLLKSNSSLFMSPNDEKELIMLSRGLWISIALDVFIIIVLVTVEI